MRGVNHILKVCTKVYLQCKLDCLLQMAIAILSCSVSGDRCLHLYKIQKFFDQFSSVHFTPSFVSAPTFFRCCARRFVNVLFVVDRGRHFCLPCAVFSKMIAPYSRLNIQICNKRDLYNPGNVCKK